MDICIRDNRVEEFLLLIENADDNFLRRIPAAICEDYRKYMQIMNSAKDWSKIF
jgi:hypothetical protein